jgi:hypothetical protein
LIKVLRQINLVLNQGILTYGSEAQSPEWKGIDVSDKYKLVVAPGLITGGFYQVAGSTSQVLGLPELYDPAERLCCFVSALGQVRVTVDRPSGTDSVFTLNGTAQSSSLPRGIEACSYWTGRVTSITVTTPTATAVKIRYTLYQLPPLDEMDSFYGGVYNYGLVTGQT